MSLIAVLRSKMFVVVITLALLSTVVFVAFNQLSGKEEEQGGNIHASLATYSFDESVQKSALIAKVRIVDKVSEINEPSPKTIFNAEIEQVYKGNRTQNEQIHILQNGTSKWTFNDNALFQPDDQMILFLMEAQGYENTYWLLAEETNFYKVVDDKVIKPRLEYEELKSVSLGKEIKSLQGKTEKGVQILKEKDLIGKIKQHIK
ncbi:hypothetical protein [Cohnella panacarvi]|uniref:hypothetical protein n=1 Tax=Cohnella panacarvi TaxID=400776 RepID=UPI00047D912F|nr:hypothetical protein [Cohnella panacarvi]